MRRHACRVIPMFGEIRAIHDQHPILFTKRLVHQALVFGKPRVIIPPALSNELLESAYLLLRTRSHS